MPSCDFPNNYNLYDCTCADCAMRGKSEEDNKKYYETCNRCNNITYIIISMSKNRKGDVENYKISYCIYHYNKYLECLEERRVEEDKIKKIKDDKLSEFIEASKNLNVILEPIGLLDECKIKAGPIYIMYDNTGKIKLSKNIFDIQKIKNRWKINKNKLELFYEMNMHIYFFIEDPRK